MKVVTVSFDYASSDGRYKHLLDVFTYSLKYFGHDVVSLTPPPPPDQIRARRFQTSNNYKLSLWIETLKDVQEDCVFCDCDMLCLGKLDDIWREEFDIAYTVRGDSANVPVNAGVIFARYTKDSIKFLEKWRKIDNAMYLDSQFRAKWAAKYCGQNQASFGFLLENHPCDIARLKPVPCKIWNVCDEDWPSIDENARLLHVKSRLREVVSNHFLPENEAPTLSPAMKLWYSWEVRMQNDKTISLGSDRSKVPQ